MVENKLKKILVIDDDPVTITLLEEKLKNADYKLMLTSQAEEGLQMAIDENPDLIILDVMMPVINGYNICRLLKFEYNRKDTPIILLTSRNEAVDVEIGQEVGADVHLTKPVNVDELLAAVKKFLNK